MPTIPDSLKARLVQRASDAGRRTAMASIEAAAQPIELGGLLGEFKSHAAPAARGLLGAFDLLQSMIGEAAQPEPAAPSAAPDPADEAALARAEAKLGFRLPDDLRELYAIADGGFGPGGGLFELAELVSRYGKLTGVAFGPAGQDWPRRLLPFCAEDPVLICYDRSNSRIVAWDPEEIEDEDSEADWLRSFKPEAVSLAALMEDWLGAPTTAEQLEAIRREAVFEVPQATIDYYASLSPEQRAEFGFPGENWEEQLRRTFAWPPR